MSEEQTIPGGKNMGIRQQTIYFDDPRICQIVVVRLNAADFPALPDGELNTLPYERREELKAAIASWIESKNPDVFAGVQPLYADIYKTQVLIHATAPALQAVRGGERIPMYLVDREGSLVLTRGPDE